MFARRLLRPAVVTAGVAATASGFVASRCLRIEEDVKLDYKDVLLRPKRSTLKSRSEVSLDRTFKFRHSKREFTCMPMIVANMDTVGTFTMAAEMAKAHCMVAIHKHYSVDEWKAFAQEKPEIAQYVCVSAGTSANDLNKLDAILTACPNVNFICLDVANGYSEFFVSAVKRVRQRWPEHTIMAGNVVTNESACGPRALVQQPARCPPTVALSACPVLACMQ